MFKNENGFSLVELAIAAGLAVALAATAVTILSGTTANLSSKANGAAGTSTSYNSDVLANASGAAPAAPAAVFAAADGTFLGSFNGSSASNGPQLYVHHITVPLSDYGFAVGKTVTVVVNYWDDATFNMVDGTVTATISKVTEYPETGQYNGAQMYVELTNVSATTYGSIVSFSVN